MRRWILSFAAAVCFALPATAQSKWTPDLSAEILSFQDLNGWSEEDHEASLEVFRSTCKLISNPEWAPICELAEAQEDAKAFFELFFRPVHITDGRDMRFTAYYEPTLKGSRLQTERFRYPLYEDPVEANLQRLTRKQISNGALENMGLEIAYVDDPVQLMFLQIQGSGRIELRSGVTIRVGYAADNGLDYKSVGQMLVERGALSQNQISANVIEQWVKRNPTVGMQLINNNDSYVFFRELSLGINSGPVGAMNRPIEPLRSLAVDPAIYPLGAPIWIEKDGRAPLSRLMIAQDTGSAIKGAGRADIFFGSGEEAGEKAERINDPGRMLVLLPIQVAFELMEKLEG